MANHPIGPTNGRHNAAKERAEGFFDIYLAMGDQRSLPKLQGILADGGLTITVNTLKNYSVNYDWQGRIKTATDKAQTLQANNHAATISEMNDRQARGSLMFTTDVVLKSSMTNSTPFATSSSSRSPAQAGSLSWGLGCSGRTAGER